MHLFPYSIPSIFSPLFCSHLTPPPLQAGQLDTLGLHGRVTLTWLLLADVQRATSDFTEDLLREISLEVIQEVSLAAVSCDVSGRDNLNCP